MADLINGTSTWAAGTQDTATILENGVHEKRAEHINGVNSFAVAVQGKLGAAAALIGSKQNLAERLNVGIGADGVLTSAEPGDICMSVRASKDGWLFCDGSEVSRSTYADLFAAISTSFGDGDGSTTFNLPDFRGRAPVGTGTGVGGGQSGANTPPSGGTTLTLRSRGYWFGAETHLLQASESGLPAHAHGVQAFNINSNAGNHIGASEESAGEKTVSTNTQGPNAAAQAHNNLQPSLCVNFFIKY